LGESLLIIFSVMPALIVTEYINKKREEQETKLLMNNIHTELLNNKKAVEELYKYNLNVLKRIDSAKADPSFQKQLVVNGAFHLQLLAPRRILYRYLTDVAWQVAKQHDIISKLDLTDASLLNQIYGDQERIMKSEDEIAKVLFSWESRKPENVVTTLNLVSDNYHGWAVDRVPGLLKTYQKAIDRLK
ncbi:MAG TPA: hypothetical protein VN958_12250, partial [Chitinophagaceae bacterium]|nr:hypothetical protein [Chitinophagaceae bacterium]